MWTQLPQRLALASLATGLIPGIIVAQTVAYEFHGDGSCFGDTVRGVGDVNADGFPDIAIGLPSSCDEDDWCVGSGEVRVCSGRNGSVLWTFLPNSFPSSFGHSVAGAGDVNSDGHADIIVGDSKWGIPLQCGLGRALVFSGSDGAILFTLTGTPNVGERFGRAVAGAGDVNGDGTPDLLVGAPDGLNYNGDRTGYARVFSGIDGSVIFTVHGNVSGERFGSSVSGVGDVNMDGRAEFIIGTPFSYYAGMYGSARLYSGHDGLILQFLTGSNMGASVAAAGDTNADGFPDWIVQSPSGARLYSGATAGLIRVLPGSGEVAGIGDTDADGTDDLIVSYGSGARVYSGPSGAVLYDFTGSAVHPVSVAGAQDLNHDGRADLLVGDPGSNSVRVYLPNCPVPTTYCTAKLNSLGCLPSVSFSGVPSVSIGADDFRVSAANVRNNQSGLLLWGGAPASIPFGGGIRCVGGSIIRTPVQNSGGSVGPINCSGTYTFHFSQAYMTAHNMGPGNTIHTQFWSRDPGYSPPNNIGLTSAVAFTVIP